MRFPLYQAAWAHVSHPVSAAGDASVNLDEAAEGLAQTVNASTEDTAEAIRAFLEKREPKLKGR